jgi:diphthamide biosynthesis methyltransferase
VSQAEIHNIRHHNRSSLVPEDQMDILADDAPEADIADLTGRQPMRATSWAQLEYKALGSDKPKEQGPEPEPEKKN